ncbi:hypothetical protein [Candidatus Regiella endosymbiont of Tuberolachnus salignus]|uniref:hypothetical protein n=1 Tax=Candidatus Regiella endosymbiont of Tuberolachnus salignus TaxID=3077956 RepID=UPI0030D23035
MTLPIGLLGTAAGAATSQPQENTATSDFQRRIVDTSNISTEVLTELLANRLAVEGQVKGPVAGATVASSLQKVMNTDSTRTEKSSGDLFSRLVDEMKRSSGKVADEVGRTAPRVEGEISRSADKIVNQVQRSADDVKEGARQLEGNIRKFLKKW